MEIENIQDRLGSDMPYYEVSGHVSGKFYRVSYPSREFAIELFFMAVAGTVPEYYKYHVNQ